MTTRLTDTEKWCDKWFRRLKPEHKLLWLYVVDKCDISGVFDWDAEFAEFSIGIDLVHADVFIGFISTCHPRIIKLQNGKFWIPKFIEFQQKTMTLSLSNNCHYGIVKLLKKHGISPEEHGYSVVGERRGSLGASEGQDSPKLGGTGKGKGKGKGSGKGTATPEEGVRVAALFDQFWQTYPKRNGVRKEKKRAREEWGKLKPGEHERAIQAAKSLAASGEMPKDAFRWLKGDWQEWLTGEVYEPEPEKPQEGRPLTPEEFRKLGDDNYGRPLG